MGVQQLLTCALQEVMDRALSNSILEMGIHATEGELLAACLACLIESIVCTSSIIAVIMFNFNAVLTCELFECALGLEGLFRRQVQHEMDEPHVRIVVYEDGGTCISLLGKSPL
jgi:hypothetical protein